jgi:hypothetical protein
MAEPTNDPYQETPDTVAKDPQKDAGSEKADSFQTSFEERLKEIENQKVAPATKKAVKKVDKESDTTEEPKEESEEALDLDFNSLFEDVYGTVYDTLNEGDDDKMSVIKNMLEGDDALQEMAKINPEQFAIYLYRQS